MTTVDLSREEARFLLDCVSYFRDSPAYRERYTGMTFGLACKLAPIANRPEGRVRILVTGSREWGDPETLGLAVFQVMFEAPWPSSPVIIHGKCPAGADLMAAELARRFGWEVEEHPADWAKHGKAAGPIRNQEMVDAGADVCLAFFQPGAANRGTKDCVSRAEKAGIPVVRYPLEGGTRDPSGDSPDSPPAGEPGLPGPGGKPGAIESAGDDPRDLWDNITPLSPEEFMAGTF